MDRPDVYEAVFEAPRTIAVEAIIAAISRYGERRMFQEDITAELARELRCRVTTVGYHSGIKTTVLAP